MSDHIAHIAICDDTFRLAALDPKVPDDFKRLMQTHREAAHMGSVTRHADLWSADIIAKSREEIQGDSPEGPHTRDKLGFVLGALTHRSADRHTKPITKCWPGKDGYDPGTDALNANESKIYQDVFVLREVYGITTAQGDATTGVGGDMAGSFVGPLLHRPHGERAAALEEHFRVLIRRALISMHTLAPDDHHIDPWLEGFFDALQTYPKTIRMYAQILTDWPADKVKQYLTDKHFYEREDPLIVLARSLQAGHEHNAANLAQATSQTTTNSSRYARTLARALEYIHAGGELYEGRITVDEAKRRLDVGVPELSLG